MRREEGGLRTIKDLPAVDQQILVHTECFAITRDEFDFWGVHLVQRMELEIFMRLLTMISLLFGLGPVVTGDRRVHLKRDLGRSFAPGQMLTRD